MSTITSRSRGFSLIEMMVVVLIIGIIAAFTVPAASTILKGSQMAQASTILVDQINLARQYALSKNHPVEVRLIRYADPEVPGEVRGGVADPTNGQYRAIQVFETLDTIDPTSGIKDFVRVPLDKPQLFPQSIVMANGPLSTILNEKGSYPQVPSYQSQPVPNDPPLPRLPAGREKAYDYIFFRFMPDGSTNLPSRSNTDPNGTWCITLQNVNDKQNTTTPPANFFTLQIDPVSGSQKAFRPGI